jgi:cytochrome b561
MEADSKQLTGTTILLHWLVGIMMIVLLATGVYMEETKAFALYPWHKSFGVLIFVFAVIRVLWRIKEGWPPAVGDYAQWEKVLAKIVHYLLIIGTVLMPISGFMMSAMGGYGVAFFGLELVAANPDPADPTKMIPLNEAMAQIGHLMHGLGGNVLIAAVVLHIVGAYKHHFVDKDMTMKRILGAKVD